MPEICRFYGIIITMFYDDHNPPHFHAIYGNKRISISIKDLKIIRGKFPKKGLNLVIEWAKKHKNELLKEWELARKGISLFKIKPLD